MDSREPIRWLAPQSLVRDRRHRVGWLLVFCLGGVGLFIVALGVVLRPTGSVPAGPIVAQADLSSAEADDTVGEHLTGGAAGPALSIADARDAPIGDTPAADTAPDAEQTSGATPPELDGWWVIVGSHPTGVETPALVERARRKAGPCGASVREELSSDFEGIRPGLLVSFSGPYLSQASARDALGQIKPCVADAYIRAVRRKSPDGSGP